LWGLAIAASCGGGSDSSTSDTTGESTASDTTTDLTGSSYDPDSLPEPGEDFEYFDIEDYENIDPDPTTITFRSVSITGDTDHATNVDNVVTINAPGIYNITGTTSDGQIRVNTEESGDVWLVLQNANITCPASAPVYIESAERVIIRLEGDDNYLRDGDSSTALDGNGDVIDAAIYSQEDLVICGEGSLYVDANYNNGIKSNDGLIIDSGTIHVTSVDDGIIGKNYVSVESGDI